MFKIREFAKDVRATALIATVTAKATCDVFKAAWQIQDIDDFVAEAQIIQYAHTMTSKKFALLAYEDAPFSEALTDYEFFKIAVPIIM